ncbi:integral peroxisomal membrane peroxin-domain-containing protein [Achaetomium macrosporum]|uniref:Integral peroxisomal membrane peroxin-domain-containing protein n=1 Tax=Achaetomium macrosporum TaxID=79813 RepID=A0AAN7C6T1_9PEZI|nr:integral peroxisomal membrane peroxin-domain-containing protein [Achaetomium macrosporum]
MSTPRMQRGDTQDSSSLQHPSTPSRNDGLAPNPTYASFSPATLSSAEPSATSAAKRRSTILVHQKSPLLLATPPQITRALAYSHPFLLPLNKLVGLLTWTTGDPWESFLLLTGFWAAVLYGDIVIRMAGPLVLVLVLIGGMYGRRFSPLSSSGWSEPGPGAGDRTALQAEGNGAKAARRNKNLSVDGLPDKNSKAGNSNGGTGRQGSHTRNQSSISEATNTRHQKTLDEIVETLREFTARCNILLEPLLELTDFLSTQRTPTSATTRPALTTLFVRILICTPFWFLLTIPPLRIITTRRVILILGTILLTWHARVIRVTRVILWRSATIRRILALVTGLQFEGLAKTQSTSPTIATAPAGAGAGAASTKTKTPSTPTALKTQRESELTKALRRGRGGRGTGVRFTFIIYENQRRWVGLGWTTNLFAYERAAWTDEHNNPVPPKDEFELPEVEDGSNMRWQWAEGSRWRVDGVLDEAVMPNDDKESEWDYDGPGGRMGWIYYDNKWQNGRRGQDGWGRWTRRRKWYRDAELVEADDIPEEEAINGAAGTPDHSKTPIQTPAQPPRPPGLTPTPAIPTVDLTPSSPDVALSPPTASQQQPQQSVSDDQDKENKERELEREEEYDTASILSTSSRSARFRPPSLRRRVTDTSHRSSRSRRTSLSLAASSEDDAAVLGTQTRMALEETGAEAGSWGVGDDVRMGLE